MHIKHYSPAMHSDQSQGAYQFQLPLSYCWTNCPFVPLGDQSLGTKSQGEQLGPETLPLQSGMGARMNHTVSNGHRDSNYFSLPGRKGKCIQTRKGWNSLHFPFPPGKPDRVVPLHRPSSCCIARCHARHIVFGATVSLFDVCLQPREPQLLPVPGFLHKW